MAKAKPLVSALWLMTALTYALNCLAQFWACAVRTMAAMLEPPPEIKMTMFFIAANYRGAGNTAAYKA